MDNASVGEDAELKLLKHIEELHELKLKELHRDELSCKF